MTLLVNISQTLEGPELVDWKSYRLGYFHNPKLKIVTTIDILKNELRKQLERHHKVPTDNCEVFVQKDWKRVIVNHREKTYKYEGIEEDEGEVADLVKNRITANYWDYIRTYPCHHVLEDEIKSKIRTILGFLWACELRTTRDHYSPTITSAEIKTTMNYLDRNKTNYGRDETRDVDQTKLHRNIADNITISDVMYKYHITLFHGARNRDEDTYREAQISDRRTAVQSSSLIPFILSVLAYMAFFIYITLLSTKSPAFNCPFLAPPYSNTFAIVYLAILWGWGILHILNGRRRTDPGGNKMV